MQTAVSDYLARWDEAGQTRQGPDHLKICEEVAAKHDLDPDDLSNAVIEETIFGAN
ncbi:hypothetical protein [Shimia sp.]|uniref:hypothetical protein n=1 Tax=Shimia sp. TaxID=1954381 RepID=UPI003BA84D22